MSLLVGIIENALLYDVYMFWVELRSAPFKIVEAYEHSSLGGQRKGYDHSLWIGSNFPVLVILSRNIKILHFSGCYCTSDYDEEVVEVEPELESVRSAFP